MELSFSDLYAFISGMFFSKNARSHLLDFDQFLGEKKTICVKVNLKALQE